MRGARRVFLCLLLGVCAARVYVDNSALNFTQNIESSRVTVRIRGVDEDRLHSRIVRGFRVRIRYTLRICQDTGRPPVFGDRMLLEMDLVQEGRWDVFSSSWEIRHANGQRVFYTNWESFLRGFLELEFPLLEFSGEQNLYTLARVRFQETVFRPPLSVLQTFFADDEPQSPWHRENLP
jgi:hypothetical protein